MTESKTENLYPEAEGDTEGVDIEKMKRELIAFLLQIGSLRFDSDAKCKKHKNVLVIDESALYAKHNASEAAKYFFEMMISDKTKFSGGTSMNVTEQNSMFYDEMVRLSVHHFRAQKDQLGGMSGTSQLREFIFVENIVTPDNAEDIVQCIDRDTNQVVTIFTIFDFQERGDDGFSQVQLLEKKIGIPVISFISTGDVIKYLCSRPNTARVPEKNRIGESEMRFYHVTARMIWYQQEYGV